jgi:hypothetical protein
MRVGTVTCFLVRWTTYWWNISPLWVGVHRGGYYEELSVVSIDSSISDYHGLQTQHSMYTWGIIHLNNS